MTHGAFIMQLILNIILVRADIQVAGGSGREHDVELDIVVIQLKIYYELCEEEGMVANIASYL